jgi:hypothetical protein
MAGLKNMRINYKIIHFVKFCKLSETMNNFSTEVFDWYIDLYQKLRDDTVLREKEHGSVVEQVFVLNKIKIGNDTDVDVIALWRVEQCINFFFSKLLPQTVLFAFRRNTEVGLRISAGGGDRDHWIDFERFLDHSIILYLRFNKLWYTSLLHQIYYAWTLFSVDYLDFDQIWLTLKILYPQFQKTVQFTFADEEEGGEQIVVKTIRQVMVDIHNHFAVDPNPNVNHEQEKKDISHFLHEKMNAVGGLDGLRRSEFKDGSIPLDPFLATLNLDQYDADVPFAKSSLSEAQHQETVSYFKKFDEKLRR